jgi:hypothetical protein
MRQSQHPKNGLLALLMNCIKSGRRNDHQFPKESSTSGKFLTVSVTGRTSQSMFGTVTGMVILRPSPTMQNQLAEEITLSKRNTLICDKRIVA